MSDGTAGLITVPVELGSRRYDVLIGGGARLRLAGLLPPGSKRAVVVTQDGIPHRDIDPGREHRVVVVPDGEGAKTLSTIEYLCSEFARFELSRKTPVPRAGCSDQRAKQNTGRFVIIEGTFRVPLHGHHEMIWRGSFHGFDDAVFRTTRHHAQTIAYHFGGLMMTGIDGNRTCS